MLTKTEGRIHCQTCGVANWETAPLCVGCQKALATIAPAVEFRRKAATQKAARLMEIVDYLLIAPATLAFLYGMFVALAVSFGNGNLEAVWGAGGLLFTYLAGCWLFAGYYRHSRGRAFRGGPVALWGGTALFNLPPFLWCAYEFQRNFTGNAAAGVVSLYYGAVVLLSLWSLRKTLIEGANA